MTPSPIDEKNAQGGSQYDDAPLGEDAEVVRSQDSRRTAGKRQPPRLHNVSTNRVENAVRMRSTAHSQPAPNLLKDKHFNAKATPSTGYVFVKEWSSQALVES